MLPCRRQTAQTTLQAPTIRQIRVSNVGRLFDSALRWLNARRFAKKGTSVFSLRYSARDDKDYAMRPLLGFVYLSIMCMLLDGSSIAVAQAILRQSAPTSDEVIVAVVEGKSISLEELDKTIHNQIILLRTEEYNLKRRALNEVVDRMLLENEAERRNITVQELTGLEIESKVPPVGGTEIESIYEANKGRYGDKPEPEVKKLIEDSLWQGRLNVQKSLFLKELRKKADIELRLDPPRMNISADDSRAKGPKDALVTVVEFADFQCPFCARIDPVLKELQHRYEGHVRIVFRDFPVHQDALKAAEAASCAQEQGKFWEMHDQLFQSQSKLQVGDLKRYASDLGLKTDLFNRCLDSGKYERRVQTDLAEGSSYGISGTPTLFINGRMLEGVIPTDALAQIIDEELKTEKARRPTLSNDGGHAFPGSREKLRAGGIAEIDPHLDDLLFLRF
jgi:protein-disulfide isomerase